MGKTIKLGGFGMSQGKCKPPDKRYRRKKKLLPGSLVVLFLGALFIAVLAGMKSAQFLEPINTSFTPCGESSKGIEQESYRFSPEADEKSYGKGEENNGSGINPEAEDAKLQRTLSSPASSPVSFFRSGSLEETADCVL